MKILVDRYKGSVTHIISDLFLETLYQPCKIADAKAEAISICVGNFIADVKPYKHLCRQHVNTAKDCFHT